MKYSLVCFVLLTPILVRTVRKSLATVLLYSSESITTTHQEWCRMAAPGEYTQRAFLNGKMDLSQAEAVADLIASSSAATHRLAMSQMRGGFSKELATLRDQLLHFTSLIELELDFSDHEELEFADRSELCLLADGIEQVISRLVQSFSVAMPSRTACP